MPVDKDIAYSYNALQRIGRHFDENQYNVIILIERYARNTYTTCVSVYNVYYTCPYASSPIFGYHPSDAVSFSIIIECDQ